MRKELDSLIGHLQHACKVIPQGRTFLQHLGTSKDPNMMVLLCSLSLSAARHSFAFTASHRAGRDNCIADALSRFDFQHFHHLAPHAAPAATPIPPLLLVQLPVI